MQAMTAGSLLSVSEGSLSVTDQHGTTVRNFLEHARAIAAGEAEGGVFTWFLATEYQWEMESACTWLVESPASRLASGDKETLRHFLRGMPEIRQAIMAGRKAAAQRADRSRLQESTDWLELASLPSWQDCAVRTAILLSQLGEPARNDRHYDAIA